MTPIHGTYHLLPQATCPHCWGVFPSTDALAVACHEDLRGDHKAGTDEMMRFLPSRFAIDGTPIDAQGLSCPELACPHCHLKIPEAALIDPALVVSVLGSPSCGKSFFLTAFTYAARQQFPNSFGMLFSDADPAANSAHAENERSLFLSDDPDRVTPLGNLIRKTQLNGNLYSSVSYGSHSVQYARPLMFSLRTMPQHPGHRKSLDRLIALYDNAGEHFRPGADSANAPVTRHITQAAFQLFLFDPTMDPRFRQRHNLVVPTSGGNERQETILAEVATRYRRLKGLPPAAQTDTPLMVVLTKSDTWSHLAPNAVNGTPLLKTSNDLVALDRNAVQSRSDELRKLIFEACPDVVRAAEAYSSRVTYFAVSVLGTKIEAVNVDGVLRGAAKPRDLRPQGVLVPFLYGLRQSVPELVLTAAVKPKENGTPTQPGPAERKSKAK